MEGRLISKHSLFIDFISVYFFEVGFFFFFFNDCSVNQQDKYSNDFTICKSMAWNRHLLFSQAVI